MPYNQISPSGSIVSGPNPANFSSKEIRDNIFMALNMKDYLFTWNQKRSQPYSGTLDDGDNIIDLYIYAWNMTPAYRTNPSEKRIQIQAAVNNIGIDRPITPNEKTIILGLYNSPTGTPLFAAWDTSVNRGHGQKSCYVHIEDVAQALSDGIYTTKDRNNAPIFTMTPEFLGDYVSLLEASNTLHITSGTTPLKKRVTSAGKDKRKKRTLRSIEELRALIASLSSTEQETIQKTRVGQGYFRDLLIDKYSCKCALCNITTEKMLKASHIKEWSASNDNEKLDENNGLLLCAHHDALFDKHLISFEDNGDLIVSSTLSVADKTTLDIASIPSLSVTPQMKPFLAVHRSKVK